MLYFSDDVAGSEMSKRQSTSLFYDKNCYSEKKTDPSANASDRKHNYLPWLMEIFIRHNMLNHIY